MRIAVLATNYPSAPFPLPGRFVHQQALALREAGHDVKVINVQPLAYRRWNRSQLYYAGRWHAYVYEGIAVQQYVIPLLPLWRASHPALILNAASQLSTRIGSVDIVHAHFAAWAGMLASVAGIPYVLTEHGSDVLIDRHPDRYELYASAFRKAKHVIAVSRSLARAIAERYGVSAKVIPNIVEGFEAAPIPPPLLASGAPLRLVTIGNLVPVKGHGRLLQAMALCREQGLFVKLDIIGAGPELKALKHRAGELGVSDQIHWLGACSRDDVRAALDAAHIYVCCSDTETFGIAPVEALTRGRPVVSTPCGGPADYLGLGRGRIARDMSPEALVDALRDVYAHYADFDVGNLIAQAREEFSPQAIVGQLHTVYQDVRDAS